MQIRHCIVMYTQAKLSLFVYIHCNFHNSDRDNVAINVA